MYMETDNSDRAAWALIALQAFADEVFHHPLDNDMSIEESRETALGDLLGNFRHLVGEEVYERACIRGRAYYQEEIDEENAPIEGESE